jgi:hypothetical protein
MRLPGRGGRDTRRLRRRGIEDLGAYTIDAHPGQGGRCVCHERGWTAEIRLGVARQVEGGKDRRQEPPFRLVVTSFDIVRLRAAVADMPVPGGQLCQQRARLRGERLLGPVALAQQRPRGGRQA